MIKQRQNNPKSGIAKIIGRIRMAFGFCPECNSDAPALDACRVCDSYRSSDPKNEFPPDGRRKRTWWRRFTQSRCTHGVPMECSCQPCNEWLRERFNRPAENPRRI